MGLMDDTGSAKETDLGRAAPKVVPYVLRDSKVVIVGEAPGQSEEREGRPFVGESGKLLERMMQDAGMNLHQCSILNVLTERPPQNKIDFFYRSKKDLPDDYDFQKYPQVAYGKYLSPEVLHYVEQVRQTVLDLKPNLILALGNTALWAFTGLYGIAKARGTVHDTKYGKLIPLYHPAAVIRQWALRPICVADFMKAHHEAKFPEVRRPRRHLLIRPTLSEIYEFERLYLTRTPFRSFDIETQAGQITCISIAPTPDRSLCIPLYDREKPDGNYWSLDDERVVWKWVRDQLTADGITRLAQNGLYDIQYLAKQGVLIPMLEEDTMLLHHAMYPELKKGLGFLASIYTNELSWKHMLKEAKKEK